MSLSLSLGLVVPFSVQSAGALRLPIFGSESTLVATLVGLGLIPLNTPLAGDGSLVVVLHGSSNTLEADAGVLAAVLAIVTELGAGHSGSRVSQTLVDVLRGGAHQGVAGVGLHGLLAMATLDVGVQGLASDFLGRVRSVGVAGRGGSRGEGLWLVLRSEVLRSDLAAGLVLFDCQRLTQW